MYRKFSVQKWTSSMKEFCNLSSYSFFKNKMSLSAVGTKEVGGEPKTCKLKKIRRGRKSLLCETAAEQRIMQRGFGYVLVPVETFESSLRESFTNERCRASR